MEREKTKKRFPRWAKYTLAAAGVCALPFTPLNPDVARVFFADFPVQPNFLDPDGKVARAENYNAAVAGIFLKGQPTLEQVQAVGWKSVAEFEKDFGEHMALAEGKIKVRGVGFDGRDLDIPALDLFGYHFPGVRVGTYYSGAGTLYLEFTSGGKTTVVEAANTNVVTGNRAVALSNFVATLIALDDALRVHIMPKPIPGVNSIPRSDAQEIGHKSWDLPQKNLLQVMVALINVYGAADELNRGNPAFDLFKVNGNSATVGILGATGLSVPQEITAGASVNARLEKFTLPGTDHEFRGLSVNVDPNNVSLAQAFCLLASRAENLNGSRFGARRQSKQILDAECFADPEGTYRQIFMSHGGGLKATRSPPQTAQP